METLRSVTVGPSYAEAPDEALMSVDGVEVELSAAAVGRPRKVDQDAPDEMQLPPPAHSPQLPLTPTYAPSAHNQFNSPGTSTSSTQSSNSESS